MTQQIIEILTFILPAILVMVTCYLVISTYLDNQIALEKAKASNKSFEHVLPLKLQAYERMLLYLERINPQYLILHTPSEESTATEFQFRLISQVRQEMEHNITQQLYLSSESWAAIKVATEEVITIINQISSQLPTEATGKQLARQILEVFVSNKLQSPTFSATEILKIEAQHLFNGITKY